MTEPNDMQVALDAINKKFGKGTMRVLSDTSGSHDKEVISTGSLALDLATGIIKNEAH